MAFHEYSRSRGAIFIKDFLLKFLGDIALKRQTEVTYTFMITFLWVSRNIFPFMPFRKLLLPRE